MNASHETASLGAAIAMLAAPLLLVACASTPFGSASDFDRTFIGAAQTWDLDKNGSVSCDEWKKYALTEFKEADGNGDGALDAQEFERMAKSDRLFEVANLAYYDMNGDGRVSTDEITSKPNLAFKLLDKNGDCQIDRNETVQIVGSEKPKEKAKDVDQTIPRH
jgi:hypothetical protein